MATNINPGIHSSFNIEKFEPKEQRIIRRLSNLFYITRHGEIKVGPTTEFRYALGRPVRTVSGLLHTEREVMLLFSPYSDFQPRTLDAFDRILEDTPEEFRVEKVVRLLLSADDKCVGKVNGLLKNSPDSPVVIPFSYAEVTLALPDSSIFDRIREFTFSRDLFSMSSPLRTDLFFYGRSGLIQEISAKLSSGENFGLFGLRRSGKTSIIHGVDRAIRIRNGASLVFDCQSPSIHQKRWHELLHYVVTKLRTEFSIPGKFLSKERYTPAEAADSFVTDMKLIKKNSRSDFIAILFDEIERISFGTASSPHWNIDRDFLLFWQTIRAGFQSSNAPFTFLLVGTNPSAIELTHIFESDNPLFGNVEKRYIPMFDYKILAEMIDELGSLMGVNFDDASKYELLSEYGGHPFLTRHACSFISNEVKTRPVLIDRTLVTAGVTKFADESRSYVDAVVSALAEQYPDEIDLLKMLATGDVVGFESFVAISPSIVGHLTGYGLLAKGALHHYFRIKIVQNYFERKLKPTRLVSKHERWEEMVVRRNEVEQSLRRCILTVISVTKKSSERQRALLDKLTQERRIAVSALSFDQLLSQTDSPLYLNELQSIISGYWEQFSNSINLRKPEFEHHVSVVNKLRKDAHAKEVGDDDFDSFRVSVRELERGIEH